MSGSRVIVGCLAVVLAAAMAVAGPPAKGKVFKLTYGARTGGEMFRSTVRAQLGTKKPEGLTAEPKYKAKAQYGSVSIGPKGKGKPFLVAMDKSTPAGKTYDVLYIDRDRDGDLGEEKPITVSRTGGDFELAVVVNGKQVNRLLSASVYPIGDTATMLMLRDRGAWQGKARVGGETLNIILADGNGNGVFNDAFRLPEGGKNLPGSPDSFLTRPMTGPAPDYGALGVCPATLAAGGKLYNATVAADGSSIAFAPFAGETATLTAPDGLSAIMAAGDRIVTVTARDGKLLVPAGKIRPFIYSCRQTDAAGKEWLMMGPPNLRAKPLVVPAGGNAKFPGGLPVTVGVIANVAGKVAAGAEVKFKARITDAAGGAIRIMPIPGEGEKPEQGPPTVIVIKQGGKVLHRGKCGFG